MFSVLYTHTSVATAQFRSLWCSIWRCVGVDARIWWLCSDLWTGTKHVQSCGGCIVQQLRISNTVSLSLQCTVNDPSQILAAAMCHGDRCARRLPWHKRRLSAKCDEQIPSSAAVSRLEWHTNCFTSTHSESVSRPDSEYKDGMNCPLVNENGSSPPAFRGCKRLCRRTVWVIFLS